jgi:hypothetical protein
VTKLFAKVEGMSPRVLGEGLPDRETPSLLELDTRLINAAAYVGHPRCGYVMGEAASGAPPRPKRSPPCRLVREGDARRRGGVHLVTRADARRPGRSSGAVAPRRLRRSPAPAAAAAREGQVDRVFARSAVQC